MIYYSLFSGGFDSALATLKVISENDNIEIYPVFFNYGQKSQERESESVDKLVAAFKKG